MRPDHEHREQPTFLDSLAESSTFCEARRALDNETESSVGGETMKAPQQIIDEAYQTARSKSGGDWSKMRFILAQIASPEIIEHLDLKMIEQQRHHCTGIYGVTIHRRPSDGQACEAFLVRADDHLGAMNQAHRAKKGFHRIKVEHLGQEGTNEQADRQAEWTTRSYRAIEEAGITGVPVLFCHYLETETKVGL